MKFISNLKIGVRLTIGFCIVIILMLALALLGYRNLVLVEGLLVDTLNIRAPISSFALNADRDLHQAQVAERTMLVTEPGSPSYAELMKAYEENKQQTLTRLQKAIDLSTTADDKATATQFQKDWDKWTQLSEQALAERQKNTPESTQNAISMMTGSVSEAFETMRDHLNTIGERNDGFIAANQNHYIELHKMIITQSVTLVIIALLIAGALSILITRSITAPIRRGVSLAETIARGNLSQRMNLSQTDEIGQLAKALDRMTDSLNRSSDIAESIAAGDLSQDAYVASDEDKLGLALQKMLANLRDIVGSIPKLQRTDRPQCQPGLQCQPESVPGGNRIGQLDRRGHGIDEPDGRPGPDQCRQRQYRQPGLQRIDASGQQRKRPDAGDGLFDE